MNKSENLHSKVKKLKKEESNFKGSPREISGRADAYFPLDKHLKFEKDFF